MRKYSLKFLLISIGVLGLASQSYAHEKTLKHGLYVFQHVCMDCHGMLQAHYSDMAALGASSASIKKWAASRNAKPDDPITPPFPTIEAAKASFGGDAPPDMSLLARQVGGGAYIEAMLKSFTPPPKGYTLAPESYYNKVALTRHKIFRMPSPFLKDSITYPDGETADIPQMAHDVSKFLEWAASPRTTHRTFYGITTLAYLLVMLGLLLCLKRTIWK